MNHFDSTYSGCVLFVVNMLRMQGEELYCSSHVEPADVASVKWNVHLHHGNRMKPPTMLPRYRNMETTYNFFHKSLILCVSVTYMLPVVILFSMYYICQQF